MVWMARWFLTMQSFVFSYLVETLLERPSLHKTLVPLIPCDQPTIQPPNQVVFLILKDMIKQGEVTDPSSFFGGLVWTVCRAYCRLLCAFSNCLQHQSQAKHAPKKHPHSTVCRHSTTTSHYTTPHCTGDMVDCWRCHVWLCYLFGCSQHSQV